MRAAQTGLAVTGHNMANAEILGFSRQRTIQNDTRLRVMGTSMAGNTLRVGTGVDNNAVHQIRSQYFDMRFRMHNSALNFQALVSAIGSHMEDIIGETENTFRMQHLMQDMWRSMQELSLNIGGIETRDIFISTSAAFLDKAHNIFEELFELQQNLDAQIRNMVTEINDIVGSIDRLNNVIQANEITGDNANDLRDQRNLLMDRLSALVPVEFSTDPRTGHVNIFTQEGNFFLSQGSQNFLGLKEMSGRYNFVEPVFTMATEVLPSTTPPREYVPFFSWNRPINAANGNEEGALMALLMARGSMPLTFAGADALWRPIALPNGGANAPNGTNFTSIDELVAHMIGNPPDVTDTVQFDPSNSATWPGDWPSVGFDSADPTTWPPAAGGFDPEDETTWPASFNINNALTWPAAWTASFAFDIADPTTFPTGALAFPNGTSDTGFLHAQLVWQNNRNNLEQLYPEFITSPASLLAAVNQGRGNATFNRLHDNFAAANRTFNQAAWSAEYALIPNMMVNMDKIVNSIVRLVNNSLAPVDNHSRAEDAPFDLNGNRSFTEVFVRTGIGNSVMPRFDGSGVHNGGLPGNFDSLYTTRNIRINPVLLRPGGHNLLALSPSGDREDSSLIERMLELWVSDDSPYSVNIRGNTFAKDRAYQIFITDFAVRINEADTGVSTQFQALTQADQRRNAIMGVSLDEETSSMMTFQFAYQAAARLFNIIDSMIDTVVNRM